MSTSLERDPARVDFQRRAIEREVWACCLNCHYWGPNNGVETGQLPPLEVTDPANNTREGLMLKGNSPGCTKFRVYPPLEVATVGCQEWLSRVPF